MESPPEVWPEFAASVFVLHQVFTQNTSAPLRTRSAHPANLLCRQRHSVPQNSVSPKVTLWPRRGSCCQPWLAKEQHRCLAKNVVFSLELQPEGSRVSTLSGLGLSSQRSEPTYNRCQWSCTFAEGRLGTIIELCIMKLPPRVQITIYKYKLRLRIENASAAEHSCSYYMSHNKVQAGSEVTKSPQETHNPSVFWFYQVRFSDLYFATKSNADTIHATALPLSTMEVKMLASLLRRKIIFYIFRSNIYCHG